MKKYLLGSLMLANTALAQTPSWAENQMPVLCGSFREIITVLQKEEYKESPVWIGQSSEDASRYALFFNPKKGNWTLVRYGSEIGCVLGIGTSSEFVDLANSRPKTY